MAFEKKEFKASPLVQLTDTVGSELTGYVLGFGTITTVNGPSQIIKFQLDKAQSFSVYDSEEKQVTTVSFKKDDEVSMFMTAGLHIDGTDTGYLVKVVYNGQQVNEKSKRTYHAYEVWVDRSKKLSN